MKIAHLISHYPLPFVGGAEACVHHLAHWQTKKGHEVKVIAPVEGRLPSLDYEVLPLGKLSARLAVYPIFREAFVRQLKAYQDRYGFDLWQVTMGFPFGVAAVDFFNKARIPCVLRCSGEDIQVEPSIGYGQRLNRRSDSLIRSKYPKFDGFISIVESITKEYLGLGIPKEKIYFIPNGVNKRLFEPHVDRQAIAARFGIDPKKKIILTVGRYNPKNKKKGLQFIPDIIKRLAASRDDFVWLLIGHKNSVIKDMAARKGVGRFLISDEIRARPEQDEELLFPAKELAELYKSADIFALPSLIEGCSNVITEAMAAGAPVVTTDAVGIRDMVEHEKTALMCKRGDIDGLAGAIERLLDDAGLRERLRKNGLAQTAGLDWPDVADRYLEAYEQVIRNKG